MKHRAQPLAIPAASAPRTNPGPGIRLGAPRPRQRTRSSKEGLCDSWPSPHTSRKVRRTQPLPAPGGCTAGKIRAAGRGLARSSCRSRASRAITKAPLSGLTVPPNSTALRGGARAVLRPQILPVDLRGINGFKSGCRESFATVAVAGIHSATGSAKPQSLSRIASARSKSPARTELPGFAPRSRDKRVEHPRIFMVLSVKRFSLRRRLRPPATPITCNGGARQVPAVVARQKVTPRKRG